MKRLVKKFALYVAQNIKFQQYKKSETELMSLGKLLCLQQKFIQSDNIQDFEFKIFSEHGDDGIIQHLIHSYKIPNKTFIEFGVENYFEATTRFLLMNNNWSGFIIDGNPENIDYVKNQNWYWKYDLVAECHFVTKENINGILQKSDFKNVGLMHIDIDGNDFHILNSIDLEYFNPSILIIEYNSVFGIERSITVPYDKNFNRTKAHFSNLYFGASLKTIYEYCTNNGYVFIGTNSAGNNAYFLNQTVEGSTQLQKTLEQGFTMSKFKESRDNDGKLTFLRGIDRLKSITGMDVLNTQNDKIERL